MPYHHRVPYYRVAVKVPRYSDSSDGKSITVYSSAAAVTSLATLTLTLTLALTSTLALTLSLSLALTSTLTLTVYGSAAAVSSLTRRLSKPVGPAN